MLGCAGTAGMAALWLWDTQRKHFRAPTCFGGARKGVPKVDCLGVQGFQGWKHCGFGTHKATLQSPHLFWRLGKVCQRWIAWVCRDFRDGKKLALWVIILDGLCQTVPPQLSALFVAAHNCYARFHPRPVQTLTPKLHSHGAPCAFGVGSTR